MGLYELADRLWTGADSVHAPENHPFATLNQIEEVATGVFFYKNFANVVVLPTASGLVLSDTGGFVRRGQERTFAAVRSATDAALHTAIYTHGHADHAYGLPPFVEESKARGAPHARVVAHRGVRERMQRYILTPGFNALINSRQFSRPTEWPTDPIFPSVEYDHELVLEVGGRRLELYHGRGETDDHTWVFLPEERVLHTGDFFVWSSPNAGNPQKVQRYAADWVEALRQMAAKRPVVLLPGHGLPVYGEERVQQALLETAAYLESLWRQTVDGMNSGAALEDLIHSVKPPAELAGRPFLQPIYDEPEFIVRNVWRCYGGWYGGTPSELKPAPKTEQGRVIAELAGGVERLLERAAQAEASSDLRLACHLVDWAAAAEPRSVEVHRVRAAIYAARAETETSTMARGIFAAAARDSAAIGG